ncbi:MAG TPA: DNA methyltransferase [Chloroflexota bacterium]|nr:DNA methyltransferase [Chloroflexota bacterium]
MAEVSLFGESDERESGPVECLGKTFPNDNARREYFLGILAEKLKDPDFRAIEGFPIGSDEDILRLSDPPYYTACPNPFLTDVVGNGAAETVDDYHREPLAVDVSEGKTDPFYAAHSYHTKVPYKAIVPAILHYTEPGDLVMDGFAGSGMTGVAAQMCGRPDAELKASVEAAWHEAGQGTPRWGERPSILNDLGPAATFIASNYTIPFDVGRFEKEGKRILAELEREISWMYETLHADGKTVGRIDYTVWSQVFACPNCGEEVVFLREALDPETKRVHETFPCPHCTADLTKDNLEKVLETLVDQATGEAWQRIRLVPALIAYHIGRSKYEKVPDEDDLATLRRISELALPAGVPTNRFPIEDMYHGSRLAPKGFTHVHHLYLPRAAQALGRLWSAAEAIQDARLRHMILFFVEQAIWGLSVLNRYSPTHFSQVNQQLNGVYYVASQHAEVSPWYILDGKLQRLVRAFKSSGMTNTGVTTETSSTTTLRLPDGSVDYIFTDPPFGENIYYADLNFLVESWHRVWTNSQPEAIVDQAKHKGLPEYQHLMQRCFEEYHRVLKSGRWMTVVFHNSSNSVWNAIQEGMLAAGFMIADVRTLDKQQGSYRQVTSTAMKQDLVISAYKPSAEFERRVQASQGTPEGVWDFVRAHLRQLPVAVTGKDGSLQTIVERTNHRLYDRMIAFNLQRGLTIPLDFAEFRAGLEDRFPERDGMYFLPDQVAEYDKKRLRAEQIEPLELFVNNEASAIQWLRRRLEERPHTQQELTGDFLKEVMAWDKGETRLELRELLQENFIEYDGDGDVPGPVHSYLSTNFKDLRNLPKDDPRLREKAAGYWYLPNKRSEADLERIKKRELLKEFDGYVASSERKLKVFRSEAMREGFKRAWEAHDYATIVALGARISEDRLVGDQRLFQYYDLALMRTGDEE